MAITRTQPSETPIPMPTFVPVAIPSWSTGVAIEELGAAGTNNERSLLSYATITGWPHISAPLISDGFRVEVTTDRCSMLVMFGRAGTVVGSAALKLDIQPCHVTPSLKVERYDV